MAWREYPKGTTPHGPMVRAQRTHDAIITSLFRRDDVATSFWHNNDVVIALCAHWVTVSIELSQHLLLCCPRWCCSAVVPCCVSNVRMSCQNTRLPMAVLGKRWLPLMTGTRTHRHRRNSLVLCAATTAPCMPPSGDSWRLFWTGSSSCSLQSSGAL